MSILRQSRPSTLWAGERRSTGKKEWRKSVSSERNDGNIIRNLVIVLDNRLQRAQCNQVAGGENRRRALSRFSSSLVSI